MVVVVEVEKGSAAGPVGRRGISHVGTDRAVSSDAKPGETPKEKAT